MSTKNNAWILGIGLSSIIAGFSCTSCGSGSKAVTAFQTDSVTYAQKDAQAEIQIYVDAPVGGSEALRKAICEYVSETLGGTYKGQAEEIDSLVHFYGQSQHDDLARQQKEDGVNDMAYFWSYDIKKTADTKLYVSYEAYNETFLGGAHGSHTTTGATFRKADGRRFGWEMMRQTDTEAFREMIKNGLKDYFNEQGMDVKTDEQLKDCLATDYDVNYLPLPQSVPYLSENGVVLTYQPYEIASYAAGTPRLTLPFDKARPYLTQTVIDMLP